MVAIFVVSLILLLALVQAQTPVASDIQAGKGVWQGYFGLENDCKPCAVPGEWADLQSLSRATY